MAIDTEDKRRSVQAYTFGLMRPLADGSIDVGDRACATWLYSGLNYGPPVPPTNEDNLYVRINHERNDVMRVFRFAPRIALGLA